MTINPEHERLLDFYGRMLLIRRFEERLIPLFERKAFRGHYHVYIGQEAIGLGAVMALGSDDYIFSTHRNHGHLLARGADPNALMAEIMAKETGLNRGRGGSFHASAPELGILHTTGVVGGGLPLAAGVALGCQRKKTGQVSLAFFGDGTLNEGAFHETINMAVLLKLPVIFLCENNDAEAATPERASRTHSVKELIDYGSLNQARTAVVDGSDVFAVFDAVESAVATARAGDGPSFIEARTKAWPGGRGSWPQLATGPLRIEMAWEDGAMPDEWRSWWDVDDPVVKFTRRLIEMGALDRAGAEAMDGWAVARADDAERFGLNSPEPDPATAGDHAFV